MDEPRAVRAVDEEGGGFVHGRKEVAERTSKPAFGEGERHGIWCGFSEHTPGMTEW
jgi:hypothetical protein